MIESVITRIGKKAIKPKLDERDRLVSDPSGESDPVGRQGGRSQRCK